MQNTPTRYITKAAVKRYLINHPTLTEETLLKEIVLFRRHFADEMKIDYRSSNYYKYLKSWIVRSTIRD